MFSNSRRVISLSQRLWHPAQLASQHAPNLNRLALPFQMYPARLIATQQSSPFPVRMFHGPAKPEKYDDGAHGQKVVDAQKIDMSGSHHGHDHHDGHHDHGYEVVREYEVPDVVLPEDVDAKETNQAIVDTIQEQEMEQDASQSLFDDASQMADGK